VTCRPVYYCETEKTTRTEVPMADSTLYFIRREADGAIKILE
jgi:hypothetical protein